MEGRNQYKMSPRDERGWLVPRLGTTTREIYDLLVEGKPRAAIVCRMPFLSEKGIDARIWKIRNPNKANAARNVANRKRAKNGHMTDTLKLIARVELGLFDGEQIEGDLHPVTCAKLKRGGLIERVYLGPSVLMWSLTDSGLAHLGIRNPR